MTPFLTVAVLFNINAVLHFAVPLIYGRNPDTAPVAAFGFIYLALGLAMLYSSAIWIPYLGIVITVIGIIGASSQVRSLPRLRAAAILFILLDIVIVYFLVRGIMG